MLQWYEQNPLWEIYKDYTTTKAVITTPKAEKMNLVQSHRLEVHRNGFRTHRDNVSVSTSQRKSERKYYKKYIIYNNFSTAVQDQEREVVHGRYM